MTSYNVPPTDETTTQLSPDIETEPGDIKLITPGTSSTATEPAWQEYVDLALEYLARIPDYIGSFFANYKQPLTTIGLFIAGIITVKITLAILDAINGIPLLAPILELVGLTYTSWFVYRYLWKASTREELLTEFEALKDQIVGDRP